MSRKFEREIRLRCVFNRMTIRYEQVLFLIYPSLILTLRKKRVCDAEHSNTTQFGSHSVSKTAEVKETHCCSPHDWSK